MSQTSGLRTRARHFPLVVLALAAACVISLASSANALTLGAVAPPGLGSCVDCEVFQRRSVAGQPLYKVPPGLWTITSWSTQGGGTAAGTAKLRVYRPTETPNQYKLVKQSGFEVIPKNKHPTFPVSLNVQGGDLLGLLTGSNLVSAFTTATDGPKVAIVGCAPTLGQLVGAGTSCDLGVLLDRLVNVKVTLIKR